MFRKERLDGLRERDGNDAIMRKVMKNASLSTVRTTANRTSLHKSVVKSGEERKDEEDK